MRYLSTTYVPAALALLAFATSCATTTETDRPTVTSSADVTRSTPTVTTPPATDRYLEVGWQEA
ncbi:MAG: hypothetical protein EOO62_36655, partial [Hymenobacter sp.]